MTFLSKHINTLFLSVSVFLVLFMSFKTIRFIQNKNEVIKEKKSEARAIVDTAVLRIDSVMREVLPVVETLKDSLRFSTLSESNVGVKLEKVFNQHSNYVEMGAGIGEINWAPHYGIKGSQRLFFDVSGSYDFKISPWYRSTLLEGDHWIEPYLGGATKTMVTGFASKTTITDTVNNKTYESVIRANFSLTYIKDLLIKQAIGKTGYSFMLSSGQKIIAHPRTDFTDGERDISFLEEIDEVPDSLSLYFEDASSNHLISWRHKADNRNYWTVWEKIPTTNWILVAQFVEEEMLEKYVVDSIREMGQLISGWLITLIYIIVVIVRRLDKSKHLNKEWIGGISVTALFITATGLIWWNIGTLSTSSDNIMLLDDSGIAKVTQKLQIANQLYKNDSLRFIPTGVFIQSLEFTSANNVTMTGYIWQKYYKDLPQDIQQGFVLPEAINERIIPKYTQDNESYVLKGWYFESVLRQPFDYTKYPFDHKKVWIRIWPNEFIKPVVLIPDLKSYPFIMPSRNPGVEQGNNFVLFGWKNVDSHFEYMTNEYNGKFGIIYENGIPPLPELYFTIHLKRDFINAFITNLIPLIVVLIMLLATFMMVSRDSRTSDRFGSNIFGILGSCSALFFLVLISHIQLRQEFQVSEIMYLEYFYFVMYGAILLVTVMSYLIVTKDKIRHIQKDDGLLPKVFFLPLVTGTLYVISFYIFY